VSCAGLVRIRDNGHRTETGRARDVGAPPEKNLVEPVERAP
jgi:hypothetical protein